MIKFILKFLIFITILIFTYIFINLDRKKEIIENFRDYRHFNYNNDYRNFNYNNDYSYNLRPINYYDPIQVRDEYVYSNKLYPPVNRQERDLFNYLMQILVNNYGLFNIHTRGPPDTFRQLGILKSKTNGQMYMLFGRAKYPRADIGDFYITTTDKNDYFKIQLDWNNSNLKSINNIPPEIKITENIINDVFDFSEYKMNNLTYYPYF